MQIRHLLYAAAALGVGVAAWAVLHGGRAARPAKAEHAAPAASRDPRREPVPARHGPSHIIPAVAGGTAHSVEAPREWTDPKYPGMVFREVKEAEYDPVREAEERLLYKKQRLRFALADAAATCYSGDDDRADIQVGYTLVVESHVLRVEDVKMLDSNLPDLALEKCILGAIRELRSPADEIPDMREAGSTWISLHDLWVRNRPKE